MKNILLVVFSIFMMYSCSTVPVTGRKQMALLPESELQSLALSEYQTFLKQKPPVKNTAEAQMVQKVGQKVAQAVQSYLQSKGMGAQLNGYKWEFNLVNDPEANAWCMPGGKIVVYSGLLPITQSEAGLAAVLGHEISHAIAKHGNERMTQALIAQGIAVGGQMVLQKNAQTQNIFNQAFGIGGQLGLMAFSRGHEKEADHMGMIFMAKAGYHPQEAINLWKRMAQKSGPKPPAIISTHPSDEARIANLQSKLKEAMVYYRGPQ